MKTGFGHFLEFGWFGMADTAYPDIWKRYSSTDRNQDAEKGHYLCVISLIKLINYSWRQVLAIFSTLVGSVWLKLHILIVEDDI